MTTKGKQDIRGRLNKTTFIEHISHLTIEDLQLVEYFDTQWMKMMEIKNVGNIRTYICKLCGIAQNWEKNFKAHVEGKKHKLKMQIAKYLYHPKYTKSKIASINASRNLTLSESGNRIVTQRNVKYTEIDTNEKKKEGEINHETENSKTNINQPCDALSISSEKDTINNYSNIIVLDDEDDSHELNTKQFQKQPDMFSESTGGEYCGREPLPKRQKIVRNPAAVYLERSESLSEVRDIQNSTTSVLETNCQSEDILISIGRKHHHQTVEKSGARQPSFSVETFCSKPRDDDVIGLVGVEYVIKILNKWNDLKPQYECSLCELVLGGIDMQKHLVGYNHRLKFCEKHFPTAIRQFRQYMEKVPEYEVFKVMTPILTKLAVAIEQHHGRDLPYDCLRSNYNSNRHEIFSKVFSCRHASEQYGPSFTHVVDSKEVDDLIAKRNGYKPLCIDNNTFFDTKNRSDSYSCIRKNIPKTTFKQPSNLDLDSCDVGPIDDETHRLLVEDFLRDTAQSKKHNSWTSNDNYRIANKKKSISPLRENDIWQAYRHMVDRKINDIDEVFQIYRSDPEQHPSYNEEWTLFWKRRKDELIEAGLDHRTYNYQPEWVRFFKFRIEQLYNQSVNTAKIESRERLCLPLTNDSNEFSTKYRIEEDVLETSSNMLTERIPINDAGKSDTPQVIPVLRLMTALEEYLGSLGPKITELLSKSLQYDKNQPHFLNAWLFKPENLSLIETAKEKFKGLVVAGLLGSTKERALKKCIDEIETFLVFAEKNRNENRNHHSESELSSASEIMPSTSDISKFEYSGSALNTLFSQDKRVVAVKLAAMLAAQGKTDCNIDDLHQLISVYAVLEKKKQEAAKTPQKPLSDTLSEFLNQTSSNVTIRGHSATEGNNSFANSSPGASQNRISSTNASLQQFPYNNQMELSPCFQSDFSGNRNFARNIIDNNSSSTNSNNNCSLLSKAQPNNQQLDRNCTSNTLSNISQWNQSTNTTCSRNHANINNFKRKEDGIDSYNLINNDHKNNNRASFMQGGSRNKYQKMNNCNWR